MSTIASRLRGLKEVCHPSRHAKDGFMAYDRSTGAATSQYSGTDHGAEFSMLALPADYDGPLLVSDIDGTLRDTHVPDLAVGKCQPPIEGTQDMMEAASGLGVPILYLSAAGNRLHTANKAFLAQLPAGILMDRGRRSLIPLHGKQTDLQAAYKESVLQAIRRSWPQARIFGLGDDEYGDARAYQATGVQSYIHDIDPSHRTVPAPFSGVLTGAYTTEFQKRFVSDLRAAMARCHHPATSTVTPQLPGTPPGPVSGTTCLYRVQYQA